MHVHVRLHARGRQTGADAAHAALGVRPSISRTSPTAPTPTRSSRASRIATSPWAPSCSIALGRPIQHLHPQPDALRRLPKWSTTACTIVKVVLWITQMVNDSRFDFETGGDLYAGPRRTYEEGLRLRLLHRRRRHRTTGGRAAAPRRLLQPVARAWWHRQQDAVLDAGSTAGSSTSATAT